jgi:hypothetical protein
MTTTRRRDDAP